MLNHVLIEGTATKVSLQAVRMTAQPDHCQGLLKIGVTAPMKKGARGLAVSHQNFALDCQRRLALGNEHRNHK
jgi:hypothetical protein